VDINQKGINKKIIAPQEIIETVGVSVTKCSPLKGVKPKIEA
jgi:hypothetical protein